MLDATLTLEASSSNSDSIALFMFIWLQNYLIVITGYLSSLCIANCAKFRLFQHVYNKQVSMQSSRTPGLHEPSASATK